MKELKIDLDHVVRHYDASRKHCPNSMMANNWARWNDFKKALAIFAEKKEAPDVVLVEYNGNKSFVETIKKDNYNYVKIRDIAKLLNKKVSYDKEKITLQD